MIIGETERVLAVKSFLVTFCDAWQKVTKENSYLVQKLVITNLNLKAMPDEVLNPPTGFNYPIGGLLVPISFNAQDVS
jgi:hypothetical protein